VRWCTAYPGMYDIGGMRWISDGVVGVTGVGGATGVAGGASGGVLTRGVGGTCPGGTFQYLACHQLPPAALVLPLLHWAGSDPLIAFLLPIAAALSCPATACSVSAARPQ
jgi:hypothetical protein